LRFCARFGTIVVNRFTTAAQEQTAPRIDIHQHLWPEPFRAALGRRGEPPRLFPEDGGLRLEMAHEPACPVHPAAHDPDARIRLLDREEIDLAVVSISTPVGSEALPADEAAPLVDAYNDGVRELVDASDGRLRAFAAAVLDAPEDAARDLDRRLDQGFVGLSIASDALATPAAIDRVEPLLGLLERRGRPLFVHPGPAPWTVPDPAPDGLPGWWTSLGRYPGQSLRAFYTWRAVGADRHPALRVAFAIMGGGAPFLEERWSTFTGGGREIDRNVYLDTASSRRLAIELALATYGAEQVVYGTDVPVIDPDGVRTAVRSLGDGAAGLVYSDNPMRFLDLNGDLP
jgi:predicted TIM-barrel fold metal-dependent hydrolase